MALSLAVVFPYLLRYIYQFGIIPQFQSIQLLRLASLCVELGGLVLATTRYRLFDRLPAAQTVGRDASFETVNTAIAVLDDQYRVTDLNIAAEQLFQITKTETIGKPLANLLPKTIDQARLTEPGEHTFDFVDTGKIIEAETTVTTDYRDRDFGRVIIFKNITRERRRQQRIQMLNRVLRHNLRNNLVVANGRIDVLAETMPAHDQHIIRIHDSLDDVVEMAVTELESEHGANRIDVEVANDIRTSVDSVILEAILLELLENAIEHTDGANVALEVPADASQIIVRDDGPGIPEDEHKVFIKGEETPFQHGSGLGLWLVKWGVGRIGGNLSFEMMTMGPGLRFTC